ncbi:MAG: 30S ribosomal protein S15 [Bacteroidetes bacterium HGW-Bacteroidetes-17]|jgi:small subunit ribosomal protein S15|nr:MAG: 30S ribosomal protein S15 [Bacteroidetes bacterium HGW-Bacteroidetes-17]
MYLTSEIKKNIFTEYGKSDIDSGSAEGQVALFTFRIKHLTGHLKINRKDKATERSLVRLVGKRRKLLDYLKDTDIERYRAIIKTLGLRK